MTLILTEITKFGIAMVADSAITTTTIFPSGEKIPKVSTGTRKLQAIPYLSAGISFWGAGSIPAMGGARYPTDVWLQEFIERHSKIDSLDIFAETLKNEFQRLPSQIKEPTGFHLAGYMRLNGEKFPTIYHVTNASGNYKSYQLGKFVVVQDFPLMPIGDSIFFLRNGDYGFYAIFSELIERFAKDKAYNELGIEIPHPSLDGRIAYLASWVIFISNLYASAKRSITIGGDVWVLGVNPEGEIQINTKITSSSNLIFN